MLVSVGVDVSLCFAFRTYPNPCFVGEGEQPDYTQVAVDAVVTTDKNGVGQRFWQNGAITVGPDFAFHYKSPFTIGVFYLANGYDAF